ncbi:HTH_Tnp_Tc3_2 domain-containing protein [Trichonephila clavipes]|nr:HTH_Tnp_Tc3_2 domain-containing protein [Trichonephila clavipes]
MQRDCALRIACRGRLTSFSVEYKTGRSDCVVRRRWNQWIREISFTRRPGSGRPRQISCREDHYIARNACVQSTASSVAIQSQVAPSLRGPVSSRTIRRWLAEGHMGSRSPLCVLPNQRRICLEWCHERGNCTVAE